MPEYIGKSKLNPYASPFVPSNSSPEYTRQSSTKIGLNNTTVPANSWKSKWNPDAPTFVPSSKSLSVKSSEEDIVLRLPETLSEVYSTKRSRSSVMEDQSISDGQSSVPHVRKLEEWNKMLFTCKVEPSSTGAPHLKPPTYPKKTFITTSPLIIRTSPTRQPRQSRRLRRSMSPKPTAQPHVTHPTPLMPQNTTYPTYSPKKKWLSLPPSPNHPDWSGRCFKCLDMGHRAANCQGPITCVRCGYQGHISRSCPTRSGTRRQTSPLFQPNEKIRVTEMQGHSNLPPHHQPCITVNVDREEDHFEELEKLNKGVVADCNGIGDISAEQVALLCSKYLLCPLHDLRVSHLGGGKFLVAIPPGQKKETFLCNIPEWLKKTGIVFSNWSPKRGALSADLKFKVVLNLKGIPLHCWRQQDAIKAVSHFGVYLADWKQKESVNLEAYSVLIACSSLDSIPEKINLVIRGLAYPIKVEVSGWAEEPMNHGGHPHNNENAQSTTMMSGEARRRKGKELASTSVTMSETNSSEEIEEESLVACLLRELRTGEGSSWVRQKFARQTLGK